jgi:hypothetical protein
MGAAVGTTNLQHGVTVKNDSRTDKIYNELAGNNLNCCNLLHPRIIISKLRIVATFVTADVQQIFTYTPIFMTYIRSTFKLRTYEAGQSFAIGN